MVDSSSLKAHRKSFQATLNELVQSSPKKVLKKPAKREPHQDPQRAAVRAAVTKSIRRVSGVIDNELKPAEVKTVEKVKEVKHKVGAEVVKKAVVKEVAALGSNIQKNLKHVEKTASIRASSGLQVDTKEIKKRAEIELQMLAGRVSPNKSVQPSLIKNRVKGRKERQQVNAAILKHVQVKDLKQKSAK